MISPSQFPAKAWQIHDILQTLSCALPVDRLDEAIPIHGVVGVLIDLSRQLADAVSDATDWNAVESRPQCEPDARTLVTSADISRELNSVADTLGTVCRLIEAVSALIASDDLTQPQVESQASMACVEDLAQAKSGLDDLRQRLRHIAGRDGVHSSVAASDEYSSRRSS